MKNKGVVRTTCAYTISVFFFPEKKFLNPRKFSIFCPRNFQSGREKNLENCPRRKIVPEKKTAKFNPRKKNLSREKNTKFCPEKYKKYPKFLPEKKKSHPEKKYEIVPEKTWNCPRKNFKKVGEKKISAREKNQKKYQKNFSRAHFIFSGKKKTLALIGVIFNNYGFNWRRTAYNLFGVRWNSF